MHHLRNTLLILILLSVLSGGAYIFVLTQRKEAPAEQVAGAPVVPQAEAKEEQRSVTSIDGAKILTMKSVTNPNNEITYSFYTSSSTEPFYVTTLNPNLYTMAIPDNSWSPGEKYIFLEKNGGGVKTDLVFKADGSVFASGQQYLDVAQLFKNKYTDYNFAGGTGWADPALLIVESTKPDGSVGPSFWFELPSGSFIQLANHQ